MNVLRDFEYRIINNKQKREKIKNNR
jgi:hypothetical protein